MNKEDKLLIILLLFFLWAAIGTIGCKLDRVIRVLQQHNIFVDYE